MGRDPVATAGMLLALILILFAAWAVSRFLGKRFGMPSSGRSIQVLEQVPLGTDKGLFLVKYRNQVYLLGSAPSGISVIDKREAEEESKDE